MLKWLLLLAGIAVIVFLAVMAYLQLLATLSIPLGMLLFLVAFPAYAVWGKNSLFWGLFDLDLSPHLRLPIRHYFAALSAFFVAGSAICIIQIALLCGPERFHIHLPRFWPWVADVFIFDTASGTLLPRLFAVLSAFTLWFMAFAVATSWHQDRRRSLWSMIAGVAGALATGAAGAWLVVHDGAGIVEWAAGKIDSAGLELRLGPGYQGHVQAHLTAILASALVFLLYATLGIYGRLVLGKAKMVAALIGPLMVLLVLGWTGSGIQFFLGKYHVPLLLVVALCGWINGFLPWADHTYKLLPRNGTPAAPPYTVLNAGGRDCAILVAAAGGGIQAAAWTAKVLEGLHSGPVGKQFDRALCLISSISGGSMGTACYVNWLNPAIQAAGAATPFVAASDDSLDEVAWGMAWPDLLRVLLPIPIRMDRALAMEKAWIGNCGSATLNAALSDWNAQTAAGGLPAVVMNSTMVEVGGPLLLGTSDVNGAPDKPGKRKRASSCWWDGDQLHVYTDPKTHVEEKLDVPAVRAARLSATFPIVTSAARPVRTDHEPHMMDGGFYDNYGMATLTEWLDQALEEQSERSKAGSEPVKRVLVLQVNGFPSADFTPPRPPAGRGGWLLQLLDPILILVNVRSAGQVSHRDVEMELLCDKWRERGIAIDDVHFQLNQGNAPLSWHLMPTQKAAIVDAWNTDKCVLEAQRKVEEFLAHGGAEAAATAQAKEALPSA